MNNNCDCLCYRILRSRVAACSSTYHTKRDRVCEGVRNDKLDSIEIQEVPVTFLLVREKALDMTDLIYCSRGVVKPRSPVSVSRPSARATLRANLSRLNFAPTSRHSRQMIIALVLVYRTQ